MSKIVKEEAVEYSFGLRGKGSMSTVQKFSHKRFGRGREIAGEVVDENSRVSDIVSAQRCLETKPLTRTIGAVFLNQGQRQRSEEEV